MDDEITEVPCESEFIAAMRARSERRIRYLEQELACLKEQVAVRDRLMQAYRSLIAYQRHQVEALHASGSLLGRLG